jgi:hypothetical protein
MDQFVGHLARVSWFDRVQWYPEGTAASLVQERTIKGVRLEDSYLAHRALGTLVFIATTSRLY